MTAGRGPAAWSIWTIGPAARPNGPPSRCGRALPMPPCPHSFGAATPRLPELTGSSPHDDGIGLEPDMSQPHPFRRALEAGDVEAMVATLSPDVVFHGPAVQRPIVGRADVIRLLEAIVATFQAFTQEFRDGPRTALVFEARIRGRLVQGVSLLEDDEHGRIKTITVLIRPLSRRTARGDVVRAQRAQLRVAVHHPAGGGPPQRQRGPLPAGRRARDDRPTDPSPALVTASQPGPGEPKGDHMSRL